jgi:hypothetical protein
MCSCDDSPWVERANHFLRARRNSPDGQWHTVDFLIQNGHCGIGNGTNIDRIVEYLSSVNIDVTREEFQSTILVDLKRHGIVATLVYPGRHGSVFIPCDVEEIRTVVTQMLRRVHSEIHNLISISQDTAFRDIVTQLEQDINRQMRNLENIQ